MKIKITEKEKEIQGTIKEGILKPFGSSSHFITNKKHRGKYVNIIIPEKAKYGWLLSEFERDEIIKTCIKIAKQENGKLKKYKIQAIENLRNVKFNLDDLIKTLEILEKSEKHKQIIAKIKEAYDL